MDFSPYRKKSSSIRGVAQEYKKYFPVLGILVILIFIYIVFLLFRFAYYSKEIAVTSVFQKAEGSIVESQISGIDVWSLLSEGETITEEDKIRVLSGPPSSIIIKNGSKISIAAGGEIFMKSTKEDDDGLFFGELLISSGPVAFEAKGATHPEKSFIVWTDENHYIKASSGSFVVQDGLVHVVKGESIEAVEQNAKGKIVNQKLIGVGQSLQIKPFSVNATEESAKFLPLYAMLLSNDGTIATQTPLAISQNEAPPTITSFSFTGSAILVSDPIQKIEGTVAKSAKKIVVSHTNGSTTSEQEIPVEIETGKWSYIASPSYATLAEGINTYKIYAINSTNERSTPSLLVLQFDPKGENVFDAKGGDLMITSPNQGKNGAIDGNIITITGTAPKDAAKIVVTNKKLRNPYTLQKFQKGDPTWKYFTAEMDPGVYEYTVEVYTERGSLISTKTISITIPSLAATPSPKTTADAKIPATTPTATVAPSLTSSTLEVSR